MIQPGHPNDPQTPNAPDVAYVDVATIALWCPNCFNVIASKESGEGVIVITNSDEVQYCPHCGEPFTMPRQVTITIKQ